MAKTSSMILSTKLPFKDQNTGKVEFLHKAHKAYVEATSAYVDAYWNHFGMDRREWNPEGFRKRKFYPVIPVDLGDSILSARMLKCCSYQAIGIINSAISKIRRLHWTLNESPKRDTFSDKTISRLEKDLSHRLATLRKPCVSPSMGMELSSICCNLLKNTTRKADYVLQLSSVFNREYKKQHKIDNSVRFVGQSHRHNNRLCGEGKAMASFLVFKDGFNVRYNIECAPERKKGKTAAIDTGLRYAITMLDSEGNLYQSGDCAHGHNLMSICKDMTRKRVGSVSYRKAQDHRRNYVNWAINQVDFTNIVELRIERLFDIFRGRRTSALLKRFPFRDIESKLQKECKRNGVRFVLQSNMYRSQRCSSCGFVHSDNRKGERFHCLNCGHEAHADVNACENHIVNLKPIRWRIPSSKTVGFFWLTKGQPMVLAGSLQTSASKTDYVSVC